MSLTVSPPKLGAAYEEYRMMRLRHTPQDRAELSEIKRFCERLVGDPDFRSELDNSLSDLAGFGRRNGFSIDLTLLRPLFQVGYQEYRFENADPRWPLANRWDAHMSEMIGFREKLTASGSTAAINPRFEAWRNRQLERLNSELGGAASGITHPLIAYELSRGCSVGCWFCGLSAERFDGYIAYTPEVETLWRGMLQTMVQRFGSAAQTGFCYWSTDPADNPDYPRFIAAHREITGCLPQTTTAAPLKNPALTRAVMAEFEKHSCVPNRFSILTTRALRQVHAEFTAEELLGVELVLQNKGALTNKSSAGRAMERAQKDAEKDARKDTQKQTERTPEKGSLDPAGGGTIACVTGFLVNLLDRKIRLVTPTRSSKAWPDGFRVLAEATFTTVEEFGQVIDDLVERNMPEGLPLDGRAAFRTDLVCESSPLGLLLSSPYLLHEITALGSLAPVADTLRKGNLSLRELLATVPATELIETIDFLEQLHAAGLLDDDPASQKPNETVCNRQTA